VEWWLFELFKKNIEAYKPLYISLASTFNTYRSIRLKSIFDITRFLQGSLRKVILKPFSFGSLKRKNCSTCIKKAKDWSEIGIMERKFKRRNPLSSLLTIGMLPTYFELSQLHKSTTMFNTL
jgi:hypothetical protein